MNKSMKIVVTGGAGFIGSHIAEYWAGKGAEVIALDNLRTGSLSNIEDNSGINFVQGDITNKDTVFAVLENADYVFHLAALVSIPESIEKPAECIKINVNGFLNVLEAAREFSVKKVVHSSSASVYGDDPELPKDVSMRPDPKTPYSITKLDGEYYSRMFLEEYGVNTVSLRYFNVFGPRQSPSSHYAAAIPVFIDHALKNKNLIIYGDGGQTRDFIFVKDVVQANVKAALTENKHGVFNVALGNSCSIRNLAEKIIELTGSKSKIFFADPRPGDIRHSIADISETIRDFNFSPEHDLNEGLISTIDFLRQQQ